ncbi:MAG: hypothetical protein ACI88A_000889 [Paraglaciecola sp.]|jgi:hypothetical protein
MNEKRVIKTLLALLCVTIALYLFFSIEIYDREQGLGISSEAIRQPYLAAQRLVEKRGVDFSTHDNYRRLFSSLEDSIDPDTSDSIVLSDAEVAISEQLAKRILAWVERGGHLILSLNSSGDGGTHRANGLLEELGIETYWPTDEDEQSYTQQVTKLKDPNEHKIQVYLENSYRIDLPEELELLSDGGDENGITFAQFDHGEGFISVMTEVFIWNNSQIREYDNALLLIVLLGETEQVHWFQPLELPHWFTLLYKFAPWFVWCGTFFIGLAMWYHANRLGPILDKNNRQFSGFSEHIAAAGSYYWQHNQQQDLLDDMRSIILHRLSIKWPSIKGSDKNRQIHLLVELSGWQQNAIEELLFTQTTLTEAQFTKWIQGLQQLRNML